MNSLNYKGKIDPHPGMIYGPDMHGASYEMISHTYDSDSDMSKAFFKPYLGTIVREQR